MSNCCKTLYRLIQINGDRAHWSPDLFERGPGIRMVRTLLESNPDQQVGMIEDDDLQTLIANLPEPEKQARSTSSPELIKELDPVIRYCRHIVETHRRK